jgi:hypothetical protein
VDTYYYIRSHSVRGAPVQVSCRFSSENKWVLRIGHTYLISVIKCGLASVHAAIFNWKLSIHFSNALLRVHCAVAVELNSENYFSIYRKSYLLVNVPEQVMYLGALWRVSTTPRSLKLHSGARVSELFRTKSALKGRQCAWYKVANMTMLKVMHRGFLLAKVQVGSGIRLSKIGS